MHGRMDSDARSDVGCNAFFRQGTRQQQFCIELAGLSFRGQYGGDIRQLKALRQRDCVWPDGRLWNPATGHPIVVEAS